MTTPFEGRVAEWCRREEILPPGCAAVVAASGGADSTALLHCLAALAPAAAWRLAVAHLDHGLRAASGEDAAFVRGQAAALGLPFFTARVEVGALASSRSRSPEEAARRARRSYLTRVAVAWGADAVALGHTADDQAETVLLNLLRGAGTLGLAAMTPAHGLFVRPLLGQTRADARTYLNERGLAWREDETNRDPAFSRNWVRLEVLPALDERFPHVRETLVALAAAARGEEAFLEGQAAAYLGPMITAASSSTVSLAPFFPAALPEALRGRAARQIYRRLVGSTAGLERRHVADVVTLAPGGAVSLPGGVRVSRGDEGLVFTKAEGGPALTAWEVDLDVPGRTVITPLGLEVVATEGMAPWEMTGKGWGEVWVDASRAEGPLAARGWRDGDWIRPVGLAGRKKLQDIFTDAKVPAAARRRWPVVTSGDDVIWVPALALAEEAAARPATAAVHLRCFRSGGAEARATGENEEVLWTSAKR